MENIIELEAKEVCFYSSLDEEMFFLWLEKISCVRNCQGKGFSIFISVEVAGVDEDALRELISLYWRYKVDMKCLAIFDQLCNFPWFKNKNSFWYESVFEG